MYHHLRCGPAGRDEKDSAAPSYEHPQLFGSQIHPQSKEKADLVQLFAFGGNLSEKYVVIRAQLVPMLQLYFPLYIIEILMKCVEVRLYHITRLSASLLAHI